MSAESDILESDRRGHKTRERRCVASGRTRDPDEMVRYVRAPDGEVVADVFGKLPGRGVWVSADEGSLRRAVKIKAFNRGFKGASKADADVLVAQTHAGLRRAFLRQLTMARKAGKLVFGDTAVRDIATRGDVALRIEARDGADRGRGKLRTLSLATAREMEWPDPKAVGCFTAEEIGEALGRDPVVHAAMSRGPMARKLVDAAARLNGFEPVVPPDWPDAHHEISWDSDPPTSRAGPS